MAITRKVFGEYVYDPECRYVKFDPPRVVTTYVGRVLAVYNRDYRAMSDVYTFATFALVLTDDHLDLEEIMVNANFECDTSEGRAEVDATPEVRSIKLLLDLEREKREEAREAARRAEAAERERNTPRRGKKMIVRRGRKVPVGTVGVVALCWRRHVLLKPEECWQDRKAQGQWVPAEYLAAV